MLGVLINNGNGNFQPAVLYPSGGAAATGLSVSDVNGDGKLDLMVAIDKSEGGVKHKSILPVFFAPLVLPEKVEDQDSGNLTLNHLRW
jgi:hypothetical protein